MDEASIFRYMFHKSLMQVEQNSNSTNMQQGVSAAEIESLDRFLSLPVANELSSSSSSLDMTREQGSDQQPSYLQYIYAKFGRGGGSGSGSGSGGDALAVDSELVREDDSDDERPRLPLTAAWGESGDISNNDLSNSSSSSKRRSSSALTDQQMVLEWRMELAKNTEKKTPSSTPNNKSYSSNDESEDLLIEEIDISRSKYADILSFESKIDNFMELDLHNDESDENTYIPSFGGKFASPSVRIKAREVVGNGNNEENEEVEEEVRANTTAIAAASNAATSTGVGGFSSFSDVDDDWLLSNPELANTLELINQLERLQLEAQAEDREGNLRRLRGDEGGGGGDEEGRGGGEEEIVINIDDDMDDAEGVISVTIDLFSEEDGFGTTADESSSSSRAHTLIASQSEFVVDSDSGGYKDRINELLRQGQGQVSSAGTSAFVSYGDDDDNEVREFVLD